MTRLVVAVVVAAVSVARSALAEPSADVADYALVAGRQLNARELLVEAGDVAVNAGELISSRGIDAPLSRVTAELIDVDSTSTCGELFANAVLGSSGACGPGTAFSGPVFPDLAAACGSPASPPACDPSRPVTVGHKQTQSLPPGVYGEVFVAGASPGRGTLVLEGGEYVFCNVHLGPRARLLADGGVTIHVDGSAHFGLGSATGPSAGSGLSPADVHIFVAGTEARFQRRSDLVGTICVAKGHLWLMSGVRVDGRGVAQTIRTGRAVVRGGVTGGTTSTTTATPTTTSTSSTAATTSSTLGGSTSTSTTTTTSVTPSTTSTSIPSTTSSTGVVATTTSTSATSTSSTSTTSTSAPTPSTSSSSSTSSTSATVTPTTSTSSTTFSSAVCGNGMTEAPETCDDGNTVNTDACPSDCIVDTCEPTQTSALDVLVNLANAQGDTFGVATVFIDYPEGLVLIPGSADGAEVQAAVTSRPTTGSPTCLVNDRDHGLQFGCLSTAGFPEGLLLRAAFRDCQNPTPPPLESFTCTVIEAADSVGLPVTADCTLSFVQ